METQKRFVVIRKILITPKTITSVVNVFKYKQTAENFITNLTQTEKLLAQQNGMDYLRQYEIKEIPYFPY